MGLVYKSPHAEMESVEAQAVQFPDLLAEIDYQADKVSAERLSQSTAAEPASVLLAPWSC